MATNNYIVAIEIGSSKISCAVGITFLKGQKSLGFSESIPSIQGWTSAHLFMTEDIHIYKSNRRCLQERGDTF